MESQKNYSKRFYAERVCLSIHFTDVCVNTRAKTILQRFTNLDRNAVKSCRRWSQYPSRSSRLWRWLPLPLVQNLKTTLPLNMRKALLQKWKSAIRVYNNYEMYQNLCFESSGTRFVCFNRSRLSLRLFTIYNE